VKISLSLGYPGGVACPPACIRGLALGGWGFEVRVVRVVRVEG